MRDRIDSLGIGRLLHHLFDLRPDTDIDGTIDSVRKNIEFRSGNAWTLVFAILIASIGLNTNSAAVIIGAMLISPLMGPIVGAGLALGTYDFEMLKRSIRNLLIAVAISIAASTIYFLLSPLGDAQSELLARTRPTVFDVLIAVFGGATGIVAASRKEKGNAVPGVAIATALMPPLCTAGYGLASGQLSYFFGALYLFSINSVFICLATYVFTRYLGFEYSGYVAMAKKRRIRRLLAVVAVVTFLPSVALAWFYVQEASFKSKASDFARLEFNFPGVHVIDRQFNFSLRERSIQISLIGNKLSADTIESLKRRLAGYRLQNATLNIVQSTLEEDLERRISEKLSDKLTVQKNASSALQTDVDMLRSQLMAFHGQGSLSEQIRGELAILQPEVRDFHLTFVFDKPALSPSFPNPRIQKAAVDEAKATPPPAVTQPGELKHIALARLTGPNRVSSKQKLEAFLQKRLQNTDLVVYELR